jgi:hypothetical protein
MVDKNGYPIEVGDAVLVPEPIDGDDLWNCLFMGIVDGSHYEFVTVVDGDGECFDIEPERLEIQGKD